MATSLSARTALPRGRAAFQRISAQHQVSLLPRLQAVPLSDLRPWSAQTRTLKWSVVAMAQPNKKGPVKTVGVNCAGCGTKLYKYRKGGKGSLVKCFIERIVEDHCGGKLSCPECGQEFARSTMIRGKPANKMIGGKVTMSKK